MSQRQGNQKAGDQSAEQTKRAEPSPAAEGGAMETVAGQGVGELQRLYPAQQQQVVMRANQVHGMRHVQRMLDPGRPMVMRRDDEGEQGTSEDQTDEELEEKRRKEAEKSFIEAMKAVQVILLPLQEQVQGSLGGTREEVQAQVATLTAQVAESEGVLAQLEAVKEEFADVITPQMLAPTAEFEEMLTSARLNLQAAEKSVAFEGTLVGVEGESDALLSRVDDEVQEALDALVGRIGPLRGDMTGLVGAVQQAKRPSASLRERLNALQERVEALQRNVQSMHDLLAGQNLVNFTEDADQDWTWEERVVIYQQAQEVAASLAEAYNSYGQTRAANDPNYQYQALTPEQAYLTFFDGNLTFHRSSNRPTHNGSEYYGQHMGNRTINVFAGASEDYIGDNPRFITHEMGHALEAAINARLGVGETTVSNQVGADRGTDLPDDRSGFAGDTWDWQYSQSGDNWEHFADMIIGWVTGEWEEDEEGDLTDAGGERAAFMEQFMPQWVGGTIDAVQELRELEPTTLASGMNSTLRTTPNQDGGVIAGLPADSEVRPTGVVDGEWVQVYVQGMRLGWVHQSRLPDWQAPEQAATPEAAPDQEAPAEETPSGAGAVALQGSATINVRSEAGTAGGEETIIVSLYPGTLVTPTGNAEQVDDWTWFEVTTPANGTGWVRCDFIGRC